MAGQFLMMMRLKPHVRACREADWIVFLDLRGNSYSAIDAAGAALSGAQCIVASEATLAQLERRGLVASAHPMNATGGAPHALRFLGACLWARDVVARGALARAAGDLSALKWRCEDGRDVRAEVQKFVRLRPWFPGAHACLFDSLALSRFMMAAGQSVDWVVGVKARPFAAHSWVECGGDILNDDRETCTPFTEVLRI
jgi:Transglutaminase-like superfamily